MEKVNGLSTSRRVAQAALLASVAVLALTVAPSSAEACRCMPPATEVQEHAKKFDAVFLGKVTAVSPSATQKVATSRTYTFRVDTYWKGDLKATVRVSARTSGAACGTSFKKGESYLVFASKADDGKYSTSSCAFNKVASGAQDWIKGLAQGKTPGGKADGACPKGQVNVIRCITTPCPVKCEPVKTR